MFENVGGKIKTLAQVVCWLGIIASVISAIALWAGNSHYNPTIAIGFGVLIGGSLASWTSSLFAYGFGELVENSAYRADDTTQQLANKWQCSKCATINSASVRLCSNCGKTKTVFDERCY